MFTTFLEAVEELSGNVGWRVLSLRSLLALLQFTGTSQKVPYISVWSPSICKCCQGDTSKLPGLEASMSCHCGPTGLFIFAYFKGCCLRVWLLISLNLGAD